MPLDIAYGSVVGKDHISTGKVLVGRNNQDAYVVRITSSPGRLNDVTVGIVCDGCGSGDHSEVGAWICAKTLAVMIANGVKQWPGELTQRDVTHLLERCRRDLLATIRLQAGSFGGSLSWTINHFFLFTVVGVLWTRQVVCIFSIGDGVYCISPSPQGGGVEYLGEYEYVSLGPFPNNSPPYLAYDLVDSSIDPVLLRFKIDYFLEADSVNMVLLGSDGADDLYRATGAFDGKQAMIPGGKHEVGPFEQFWTDNRYFTNQVALSRRLRQMNSEVVRVDKQTARKITYPRLLPDDTTLVVVRRPL